MNNGLIQQIDKLVGQLQDSDKTKVADYFISLRNELSSKRQSIVDGALLRLHTSASICQYASFSYKEDKMFSDIHRICSEMVSQRNLK